ncbi:MAG: hypothetical protein HY548_07355 [Elusimicrobia bacterium]|nr:hypothetical protein [Elusimicrobiota bacterium]
MEYGKISDSVLNRGDEPKGLHPAWWRLIAYCRRLRHGELAKVQVQDGLPVAVECVKERVKFT